MGTQNDTIELNGYRYDARTGAQLGRATGQRSVDGFVRSSIPAKPVTPKKPAPSHSVHAKVSKSQTLRRQGLKKPEITPKQTDGFTPSKPIVSRHLQPDQNRAVRATQTEKHPNVSKFQANISSAPLEIKPAPVAEQQPSSAESVTKTMLPLSPFDMALNNSTSHEQLAPKRRSLRERTSKILRVSPRAFSVGLGILVVLTAGGLFAKQHLSTLAVQLAATRSGVEAKLPGYEPAGFSLSGPVEYSAGQIALSYQSNTDDRNFKIVQKNSDWNSQALLENFIQESNKQFQTIQDKGKTIYIYAGNNATWVSGGIWFQVEGESSLNTDQLLRIAAGL